MRHGLPLVLCCLLFSLQAAGAVYEVGPGLSYSAIGDVPWESLGFGDTVRIHWRPDPYREKWVITRQGTALAPIVVQGVPGPAGELPVIHGDGAVTPASLNFWSESRGIIKIGGSNSPPDLMPQHILIENLDIAGARPPATFTADDGSTQTYGGNAATIFVEKGENITIRNCILRDSGNGLFVASSDTDVSRDILIEANFIHGNGNVGSIFEHNSYTAALGITYQYNHFGPPCVGCGGNNLKDRSAGMVVRYNWIEGGNRQLDLVNAQDSVQIRTDPAYGESHVYGNVLVEHEAAGNRQVLHYGGDTGSSQGFRKGLLYFYNNTVVSYRTDRTTLMRLSTNDEECDARNNIVYLAAADGDTLSLLDVEGTLSWSHNWLEPGWRDSFGNFVGTLNDDLTSVEGTNPGFVDAAAEEFQLATGSACADAGMLLHPAVLPAHDLGSQYVKHRDATPRPDDGMLDMGAHELVECAAAGPPGPVTGLSFAVDGQTVSWTAVPDAESYQVVYGDVGLLVSSGGSFESSLLGCLAGGLMTPVIVHGSDPALGIAFYYVARALGCAGIGTYDGLSSPAAPRDTGITAATAACP